MKLPSPGKVLWFGTYPGHLYPLSRPRFAKGHAYQPLKNQQEFRKWLKSENPDVPWTQDLWIEAFFCFKTKKLADIDNLAKAVLDGLQAARFLVNDKMVCGATFARMHGASHPSATILIREVEFYDTEALPDPGS
ncbi:MAG TPA: RusA family crossover junction endodeoxyribonuclease [Oligoflexus sp.]|uniref:RusA family crossover junction endodeoxyribonuclease n=1 Tax=Oligoflexus sp. TaxID=1971216 RepID=UPI002D646629|nr:RusA family crossover junction endodeoxyribonuclease [Oligoflexus sp.]HYX39945.1 RusA family crossover junction endodeoxyribonuclease [Oligoflexus sp.]